MKEARVRLNTAQGTERSHAYYNTWQESLMDYALYAATYLKTLSTEEQYYTYLEQNYAEDPDYVKKLKKLITTQELKKVFK
jgi:flagellum-specific peptidoglycan hydrolase FlgJ